MGVLLWPQPAVKGKIKSIFLVRVLAVMSMIQRAVTHHTVVYEYLQSNTTK